MIIPHCMLYIWVIASVILAILGALQYAENTRLRKEIEMLYSDIADKEYKARNYYERNVFF